ncbi:MAG: NAD+ synthase [Candidatus Magasanikbacteria bacterium]|nr:NAD+ synthase [Candidatus Magasanikbacteria bacterium]
MNIALAQHNYTVGDIAGNTALICASVERAAQESADAIVFSEMAITGYPPMDLLDQKDFVADAVHAITVVQEKSRACPLVTVVVGGIDRTELDGVVSLYNSAYVLRGGAMMAVYHKSLLPTYDVFDERRYFASGTAPCVIEIAGEKCGITICEDIWNDRFYWPERRYGYDPVEDCVARGARILINLSASPYHAGKEREREAMVAALAKRHGVTVMYVNQVGGNDELIFDGHSFVMTLDGVVCRAPGFEDAVTTVTILDSIVPIISGLQNDSAEASIVKALTLGIRDYVRKCGFKDVVIGLSGGIDSAVTAALAVRALGAEHVRGIGMPSKFSSQGSIDDARQLANNLCIQFDLLPIEPIVQAYAAVLAPVFAGTAPGVAEENIQARIRGALLMALSNKSGALLLTTGNKSELAVGYCTLYGDMSGGLAVIADLSKGMVYRVARFINEEALLRPSFAKATAGGQGFGGQAGREIIPVSTLTKAPSAELRPNQTDQDTLPPYDTLDEIIHQYVEEGQGAAEIIGGGFDPSVVGATIRMINQNEYKRRQAAPGLRVTSKAFGVGRRMPIAAKRTRI